MKGANDVERLIDENAVDVDQFLTEETGQERQTGNMAEPDPPEPCPIEVLPDMMQRFVVETASAIGVDPAFIVPFVLSVISGMMGRLFQIELKPGYRELPSIWTVVVASPGGGKTPALNAVLDPIRFFQVQADKDYGEKSKDYEQENERFHEWKKSRKQKALEPPLEKPIEPIPEQFLIDNVTTEAVTEILEQNPHGALLAQDELSGFLNGFDGYSQTKKDVPFWCSIFNGVTARQNRKTGRKLIYAHTPAVAICGGIQPDILKKTLLENAHYFGAGLASRFLFVMPEETPNYWNENVVSESAKTGYFHVIESLLELRRSGCVPADDPVIVSLSREAKQKAWIPFQRANVDERLEIKEDGGRAAWSKFQAYAARMALILHVIQWIESTHPPIEWPINIPPEISSETMWNAIRLLEWFKGEAARMLNMLGRGKTACDREAMTILQVINAHGGNITIRELVRSRSRYQKHGGSEEAETKLRKMVSQGLLEFKHVQGEKGRGKDVFRIPLSNDNDTIPLKHGKNDDSVIVIGGNNVETVTWEPGQETTL